MKKLKKYKTFENLQYAVNEHVDVDKNEKIKEILENIIKTKRYVIMLRDTTDRVFELIGEQFPKTGSRSFIENLKEIDDFLGNLVEELYEILQVDVDSVVDTIDMLLSTIGNIKEYTSDGNIDLILSQQNNLASSERHTASHRISKDILEEEEEEEEENNLKNSYQESESLEKDENEEDQLKRRK